MFFVALIALVILYEFTVWRLQRAGVFVSDRGVRVTTVMGSTVVPWPEVDRFVIVKDGRSLFLKEDHLGVVRRGGDTIEAPMPSQISTLGLGDSLTKIRDALAARLQAAS